MAHHELLRPEGRHGVGLAIVAAEFHFAGIVVEDFHDGSDLALDESRLGDGAPQFRKAAPMRA